MFRFASLLIVTLLFAATSHSAYKPSKRKYDAQHYRIAFAIDPAKDPKSIEAQALVRMALTKNTQHIELDLDALHIHWVDLVQKKKFVRLKYELKEKDTILRVEFPEKLKKKSIVELQIQYRAPINSDHGGLFKVNDVDEPKRGNLYFTQFEPIKARNLFPCNDQPFDKATTEVKVQVPLGIEVISNGARIGDSKIRKNGRTWREIHWRQNKPHPTYLVALAIGKMTKLTQRKKAPAITFWVGKESLPKAQYAAKATQTMLDHLEKYLGVPYPWNKYASVTIPRFFWGGMENTSATFLNQERSLLNDPKSELEKKRMVGLIAHEIAHQWFGNYATMKWWDDIWLNEAFASYLGTFGIKKVFSSEETDMDLVAYTWDSYFSQEDGPRSHPIVNKKIESPMEGFDSISYTKGENVLRMLEYYIGPENYRKGLKAYLEKYAIGNATHEDFFKVMAKASNENLKGFRKSWLHKKGYPVLTYKGKWVPKKNRYEFELKQHSNHKNDGAKFTFKVPVTFHREANPSYHKTIKLKVDGRKEKLKEKLPAAPEWITVNAGGVALAKLDPNPRDEKTLTLQAKKDPDAITRLWASLTLMKEFKKETKVTQLAEDTVIEVLQKDPSPYLRANLLHRIQRSETPHVSKRLGDAIFKLAKEASNYRFQKTAQFKSDPHGWRQVRARLFGALGKVDNKDVFVFLERSLRNPRLPLDDLANAAKALAMTGKDEAAVVLGKAAHRHKHRGYRYRYQIEYAFGSYENPKVVHEIARLSKTAAPDLLGRLGWALRKNETLMASPEWPKFLENFILKNDRFGDGVKARLLVSIEKVKTPEVEAFLKKVEKETQSKMLKEACKKIIKQNFS